MAVKENGNGSLSQPAAPAEPLWTLEDVASFLRVSTATVRRWTNAGLLPCYRVGGNRERRFVRGEVMAFIEAQRQPMAAPSP